MTAALNGIPLPDYGTTWTDEAWSPVTETTTVLLTGALLVEQALQEGGRPITLRCEWVPRTALLALLALAQTPQTLALTLPDGRAFSVAFRFDQAPVDAERLTPPDPDDETQYYTVTLRLRES